MIRAERTTDIDIHAREVLEMTRRMAEIIARLAPREAVEYGLIDSVIEAPAGAA